MRRFRRLEVSVANAIALFASLMDTVRQYGVMSAAQYMRIFLPLLSEFRKQGMVATDQAGRPMVTQFEGGGAEIHYTSQCPILRVRYFHPLIREGSNERSRGYTFDYDVNPAFLSPSNASTPPAAATTSLSTASNTPTVDPLQKQIDGLKAALNAATSDALKAMLREEIEKLLARQSALKADSEKQARLTSLQAALAVASTDALKAAIQAEIAALLNNAEKSETKAQTNADNTATSATTKRKRKAKAAADSKQDENAANAAPSAATSSASSVTVGDQAAAGADLFPILLTTLKRDGRVAVSNPNMRARLVAACLADNIRFTVKDDEIILA